VKLPSALKTSPSGTACLATAPATPRANDITESASTSPAETVPDNEEVSSTASSTTTVATGASLLPVIVTVTALVVPLAPVTVKRSFTVPPSLSACTWAAALFRT
jgi:hypothetical protein